MEGIYQAILVESIRNMHNFLQLQDHQYTPIAKNMKRLFLFCEPHTRSYDVEVEA